MLKREVLTGCDIDDILTNAIIINNTDFSFFCHGEFARYLEEILDAGFDLVDEECDEYILDEEIYSVSGLQLSDGYQIFIEKAFTDEGIMKVHEIDGIAYIITDKLTINQIIQNVRADKVIFCEIDKDNCFDFCFDDDDFEDDEELELVSTQFLDDVDEALAFALDVTSDPDVCIDCKIEAILDVSTVFIEAIRDGILIFEK